MGFTQEQGKRGEDLAAAFLRQRNFRIVARNVRTPHGEIDLVCEDGTTVVFVEVKYRASTTFGEPEEVVLGKKLRRMRDAAEWYVTQHALPGAYRVDVVGITGNPPRCTHLEDVSGA
jgi:putative endonuclease